MMEECRVLKSIYMRRAAQDDLAKKTGNKMGAITKTKTMTKIGTHDTSMSFPPTWYTLSLEAKFPSSLSEKESS